jgi:glycosyltransferase involved in cell wall biosynthesis
MDQAWLTVVLPSYNGACYLSEALESLCRQDHEGFSVIAVDDGSTDGTLDILDEYSGRLPLRIIRRKHEGNWLANTNRGMELAEGKYVAWLHQDDRWEPSRVGTLKRLFQQFPDAPLLFHPSWYIDAHGRRLGTWRCPFANRITELDKDTVRRRLLVQDFLCASALVFRRDVIDEIGLADEDLWYTGDWDYWLKLMGVGNPVYYPHPLTSFRIHSFSQTNSRCDQIDELRRQYSKTLARHLDKPVMDGRARSRTEALAQFSVEANLGMMRLVRGSRRGLWRLPIQFASLGPIGWYVFLRDSRIAERVTARIRASFGRPRERGDSRQDDSQTADQSA